MSDLGEGSPLGRARERREALAEAADALDDAVARPSGDEQAWKESVAAAIGQIDRALDAHIVEVEGDDGLYREIMARTPRLAHQIEVLQREHVALRSDLDTVRTLMAGPSGQEQIDEVREHAVRLLADISRHRHRGSDLIYDSYDFEIGGEGD